MSAFLPTESMLDALAHAMCGAESFEALCAAPTRPTITTWQSGGTALADAYDARRAEIEAANPDAEMLRAHRIVSEPIHGALAALPPAPVPSAVPTQQMPSALGFLAAQLRAADIRVHDANAVLGRRVSVGDPEAIRHALDVAEAAKGELEGVIDDIRRVMREAEFKAACAASRDAVAAEFREASGRG